MKKIALFIWQLPQNLLGILWYLINNMFTSCYHINSFDGIDVFKVGFQVGAVSLGKFIFVSDNHYGTIIQHEYGHCIQSRYLGWLYLPIIGIPSFMWACIYKCTNKDYYWLFCEKWADKLGGVTRLM